MNKINILYVIGNPLDYGGISTFVMSYYREIHGNDIHIDFLVYGNEKGVCEDEILRNNSQIFHVPIRSKKPLKHHKMIKKILKSQPYDMIHAHVDAMNGYVLGLAKKARIKVRISHAHNTAHLSPHPLKKMILNHYKKNILKVATHFLTCSKDAAAFMYPSIQEDHIIHIKNATNLKRFRFDQGNRDMIRASHRISSDTILIGHIGRFDYQKNHQFLLELIKEVKVQQKDIKLLCIGDGHLKLSFLQSVKEHQLKSLIEVIDPVQDIEKYYSAYDVFVLPSLFEGFGYVLIEAQYNGLTCVSSTNVPLETNITKENMFVSLKTPLSNWIEAIETASKLRKLHINQQLFSHYDINDASKLLKSLYQESVTQ
jgi:glycosyltransferase involved in cell wall biosynthesis